MPTPTYDLIASNVLGSNTASVTFSSIPSTYRDLVVVSNYALNGFAILFVRFNGNTSTQYNFVEMQGDGANTNSYTNAGGTEIEAGYTDTGLRSLNIINILDYATSKHKSLLVRHNTNGITEAIAGRWANTSAITSVTLTTASRNFTTGSTFYLYGIVS